MDRFFHERLSSKPLGLFRLLWGVFLVFYLIDGWWVMHLYSGAEGLRYQGWMPEGRYTNGFWSLFQWASNGSPWFELVYGAALLSAVAMALGWWVRVTSVVAWVCLNSLITPLAWGFAGVDFIVSIMTFLMMVASLGGHSAHWYALRRESSGDGTAPAWIYRVFQVQLCFIYFFSGLWKVTSDVWQNGTAMHFALGWTASSSRVDFSLITQYPVVNALLTHGVMLFELVVFPFLIWFAGTRRWVLVLGLTFHLGVWILMDLAVFGGVVIVYYACFLTPTETEMIVDGVSNRIKGFKEWWLSPVGKTDDAT